MAGGHELETTAVEGLHALPPEPLPFGPELEIRSFLLEREDGNLLVYGSGGVESGSEEIERLGGASRLYLNHRHEAMFLPEAVAAPVHCHEAESKSVAEEAPIGATFSERHVVGEDFEVIPMPGHTEGATVYLWTTGSQRLLFTGDSVYLSKGEWNAAVLDSSDRAAYIESLERLRELEFDVLVPWGATTGHPYLAATEPQDARRRFDSILARVRDDEKD